MLTQPGGLPKGEAGVEGGVMTRSVFRGSGWSVGAVTAALVLGGPPELAAGARQPRRPGPERHMVPMRDGVRLATYVWLPVKRDGPVPVVVNRMPYDPRGFGINPDGSPTEESPEGNWPAEVRRWVDHGYAFIYQNHRGRYASEGQARDFYRIRIDGYDTFEWIIAQSWSNGRIGTTGCSAGGQSAMYAATLHHPSHKAVIMGAGANAIGNFYNRFNEIDALNAPNSPFRLVFATAAITVGEARLGSLSPTEAIWQLPLSKHFTRGRPPQEQDRHDQPRAELHVGDTWSVPVLNVNGWADHDPTGQIAIWRWGRQFGAVTPEAKAHQYLVMFPGTHCSFTGDADSSVVVGERNIGDARGLDYDRITRAFFDHWLKREGKPPELAPMTYFVPGRGVWRSADDWPPPRVERREYYLTSQGNAATSMTDGRLIPGVATGHGSDGFVYDPRHPAPTKGGQFCCMGHVGLKPGSFDQREIEARPDVLVYTSAPLTEGIEIAGPIGVTLYVSSSAKDTDFIAKLVNVDPDGRAFDIRRRGLMVRYRNGSTPEPMRLGEVYKISFQMMDVADYFPPGHRIRLDVSSSDFPLYLRNLNTGDDNWTTSTTVVARNRVHHSPKYPSKIVLPVLPP